MPDATPLLKLYARFRSRQLQGRDHRAVQQRQLLRLVGRARATRFGCEHDFAAIRSVPDFQERVPLRAYEDFWKEYWQPVFPVIADATWPGVVPYFAETSGTTTGVTKYIPCTEPMIASNIRAGIDLLAFHVVNRPDSAVFAGPNFMLGGSTRLKPLAPGVRAGDVSGILAGRIPWWARRRRFPPEAIAAIPDWEARIEAIAEAALRADIRTIGGAPSWLLILFDRLAARRPLPGGGSDRRLARFFPNLELLVHGGVNFAPYRPLFKDLLDGARAETREVYPASEGFIALADRGDGEGLRLMLDTGLFFEFVPVEELESAAPTRHWIGTAHKDVNYAIALSTCAGLWSYLVGDTVRFVDLDPPRILVTGRISYMLSAFGEHLIAEEIETAVARAAQAIAAGVTDYAVGAVFPQNEGDLGRHLFLVEFAEEGVDDTRLATFARVLDQSLAEANDDYKIHRDRDYAMGAPEVRPLKPGAFAAWMKSRGQLGDQHKVPRIINDQGLFDNLRTFVGAR